MRTSLHICIKPELADKVAANVSLNEYAGPEQRFAQPVYEYNFDGPEPELVINAELRAL